MSKEKSLDTGSRQVPQARKSIKPTPLALPKDLARERNNIEKFRGTTSWTDIKKSLDALNMFDKENAGIFDSGNAVNRRQLLSAVYDQISTAEIAKQQGKLKTYLRK